METTNRASRPECVHRGIESKPGAIKIATSLDVTETTLDAILQDLRCMDDRVRTTLQEQLDAIKDSFITWKISEPLQGQQGRTKDLRKNQQCTVFAVGHR
ncbi:hypothetical protein S7711_11544 [Stachybotrys chartarum IBT 7711]|uniref:Uncharacterized protein n=1 Tax=Stachybotrys chartarum (strain CBS 109288 / IBT 7711) TaxID=1280523 RepID=A0A084B1L7_STACB|nr:hypothetical protein S7711_11544 [Stachybotrys chartarum IBT 7711]